MKVIGTTANQTYICVVDHSELEKFLGLYYNKLKTLEVGSDVDLSRGADYASKITDAMQQTRDFVKANQAIVTAILNGMNIEALHAVAKAQNENK